ncbi:MerR family transcriptional regulator [Pseudonocardia acaciae]|uniref:MerR family transcriptional regulator n=1 Tax=Pseudonocardia acaciae TaxID=551276 RepID=UPI00049157F2|nr:MerR family DNA-binding transcriptional regulator [Pseudonocardia acaciae]
MTDDEWLLIAEFARRCRLPVSTLRYYDRVGLLRPAAVDPDSGYRRYHRNQLPTAVTIARFRAIGTAPDDIARILRGGESATSALAAERRRLTDEITERAHALAQLYLAEPCGTDAPRHLDLPARTVPALGFTAPARGLASAITRGIAILRSRLRHHQVLPPRPTWGALLPLDLDDEVAGYVFARTSTIVPDPRLTSVSLPAGPAVETTHHGAHDQLAFAYDRALTAAHHSGQRPAEPVIEDYLPARYGARPATRISVPIKHLPGPA